MVSVPWEWTCSGYLLCYTVAHPESSPIEMVWGNLKVALQRSNTDFSLARLQQLVQREFERINPEV